MKAPITQITTRSELTVTVGNNYILDKEFRNGSEIKVVAIYGKHFCRVQTLDEQKSEWDTMLYRLSEIEQSLS